MISNPIIFYIASFLLICFALISMFLRNIIYSLIAAVIVFFAASIIFYILGSEYNAIIQAAIYGFAVPIIIGISIMFTIGKSHERKSSSLPFIISACALCFILLFMDVFVLSNINFSETFHIVKLQQQNSYDVISGFARGIFIDYVWAFELLSLLLTIVIAGLTLFKKREYKSK